MSVSHDEGAHDGGEWRRYSAEFRADAGPLTAMNQHARAVVRDRWQIWTAFKRNFIARYRNTVLGAAWSIILPLVPISAYAILAFLYGRNRPEMPYLVFTSLGVTIFSFATGPISGIISAMRAEWALFAKSQFAASTVILSSLGHLAWDLLIRTVAIVAILAFFRIAPHWTAMLAPLVVLAAVMTGLGIGIFAALMNSVIADVEHVITVVLRYLVFFSAVIFPLPDIDLVQMIVKFNPFYTYVMELRSLVVFGRFHDLPVFAATSALGVLTFVIAATALYRAEGRLRGLSI